MQHFKIHLNLSLVYTCVHVCIICLYVYSCTCFTVTLVTQPPHHCGRAGTFPNYFINNKVLDISLVNTVTSLVKSFWPSPPGDLNSEVPLRVLLVTINDD